MACVRWGGPRCEKINRGAFTAGGGGQIGPGVLFYLLLSHVRALLVFARPKINRRALCDSGSRRQRESEPRAHVGA